MLVGINPYHYHFTDDLDTTNAQIQDLLLRQIIDRDESQTQVNRDAMLYVEAKIVLRLHLQSILLQITGCAEIERIVHVRPPGRTSPMVIWRQAGEEIHTFLFLLLG